MTIAYTKAQSKRSITCIDHMNTPKGKVLLLSMGLLFVVLYVYQTSILATRTFAIHELGQELHTLEQEQRSLDVQIAEHRSLQNIESRLSQKNYVAVSDVSFIFPVGTAVAQR